MRRGLEEDVPPLVDEIELKVLVVKRMVVEKIVVVVELMLDEMHLFGMQKEERANVMEAKQKRRTIVVLLLEKIGSCGYINDSYYCVS
jgi:hypothetical protein